MAAGAARPNPLPRPPRRALSVASKRDVFMSGLMRPPVPAANGFRASLIRPAHLGVRRRERRRKSRRLGRVVLLFVVAFDVIPRLIYSARRYLTVALVASLGTWLYDEPPSAEKWTIALCGVAVAAAVVKRRLHDRRVQRMVREIEQQRSEAVARRQARQAFYKQRGGDQAQGDPASRGASSATWTRAAKEKRSG